MYKDKHWIEIADEDDFALGMAQIQKTFINKAVTFVAVYQKSDATPGNESDLFNMDGEENVQTKGKTIREKSQQKKVTRKALRNMMGDEAQF